MKNQITSVYRVTPEQLYALERQARAQRAKEIGRLGAMLVSRIAKLFHAPQGGVQLGRKGAGHA